MYGITKMLEYDTNASK